MILEFLARSRGSHGVREIAATLRMNKSTTHRLLEALVQTGYAKQDDQTEQYSLGLKAVEIGALALSGFGLLDAARVPMEQLVRATGQAAFLGVLDRNEVVYLHKAARSWFAATVTDLTLRRPAHATAGGKVMMAFSPLEEVKNILSSSELSSLTPNTITDPGRLLTELERIRAQGFAVNEEEVEPHLCCVAAPLRDYRGQVVGAISLKGHKEDWLANKDQWALLTVQAAAEISARLGYVPEIVHGAEAARRIIRDGNRARSVATET